MTRHRHHVGHQAFVAGHVFAHNNHTLVNRRMLIQNCFDLAQFDPVAPHFHLMVCPSLKLDASVRKKPSHVPRLVEFRVWFIRERISDEFLRR